MIPMLIEAKNKRRVLLGLGVTGGYTNYLRACLDMLKVDHASTDAYEKQRIALRNIPRIAHSKPSDGVVLAPPLVGELVRLSNHFNVTDFDSQKEEALMAPLITFPSTAVPAATACISSSSYTYGARMYVTKLLANAAYALSGLTMPGSSSSSSSSSSKSKAGKERRGARGVKG